MLTAPLPDLLVTLLPILRPLMVKAALLLLATTTLPSGSTTSVELVALPVSVKVLLVSKPVIFTGSVPVLSIVRFPTGLLMVTLPVPRPVL